MISSNIRLVLSDLIGIPFDRIGPKLRFRVAGRVEYRVERLDRRDQSGLLLDLAGSYHYCDRIFGIYVEFWVI